MDSPDSPIDLSKDAYQKIRLDMERGISSIGPSFYVIHDYRNQHYRFLNEGINQVLGYTLDTSLSIQEFQHLIHPEDIRAFRAIEEKWHEHVSCWANHPNASFTINFDFRVRHSSKKIIRLLLQVVHSEFDEAGRLLFSIEKCTDISCWKRTGAMVLSIIGNKTSQNLVFQPQPEDKRDRPCYLSKSELKILRLLAQGKSSKEIASTLKITFNTANTHRRNILRKTGVRNTTQLVKYTLSRQLP
uniref:LuxR C-terminal-related transcriptional regulator n=1 Tax=Roseihalotalea indica TaxID=2867963 RepID=A0AA49JIJ3_9BACT|nr:LuxR C-terminal-related transcriptional regulator [Tunicatimonas sp. TK19036]